MNRIFLQSARTILLIVLFQSFATAEVTRIEITAKRDLAAGRAFGSVGPYERLSGKIYFAVDPRNRRNQVIADIDRAPKNAAGTVEMSADLVIIRPRDAARSNGIALFDIVNRGATVVLNTFNGQIGNTIETEAGDGFLFTRGYTIVQVGWEFDARRENAVRIDVPGAAGITGLVRANFIPNTRNATVVSDLVGYKPADAASAKNTLRVRNKLGAEWVTIPRNRWQLSADNTVTLEGGFTPGATYELSYVADNPPISGLGFAAVRDAAAWVKHAPDAAVSAKYTFAFGSSQTGRWLRDFIYEGFNSDERERQVFDGIIAHKAGAAGAAVNVRWSTPTSLLMESASYFPFSDRKQGDPATGADEGVLENPRAGKVQPKVFYTFTDTEYWERSGALAHMTPDGSKDFGLPENVRLYHFAGTPHNSGKFPPAVANGEASDNPIDYLPLLRALLVSMEKWVRGGVQPPPSRYPRLQDRTLVRAAEVSFPSIAGVSSPTKIAPGNRGINRFIAKDGGAGTSLPLIVPQVDHDGNPLGGLKLPDVAVPLATYTGWNFRNPSIGGTEQVFPLVGAYVPFAVTKADRERTHDVRLSIEERYASRDEYLRLVRQAGDALVKDRYLLADDLAAIIRHAGEHWDLVVGKAGINSTRAQR